MVKLPERYVQFKRKYPGYFWDTEKKEVCSLKSGVLKPLKTYKYTGSFYAPYLRYGQEYTKISVKRNEQSYPLMIVFEEIERYIDRTANVLYHE